MAEYIEREEAIKAIAEDKIEMTPELIAISRAIGTYTAEQAFDGINQACDRHIESIKIIPAADVQPVKWIPVTERLPEAHEAVVVFHPKYSNSHIAAYYRELETQPEVHCVNKWYVYGGFGVVLNPEPTHWMPIPEPPKDGET